MECFFDRDNFIVVVMDMFPSFEESNQYKETAVSPYQNLVTMLLELG